MIKAKSTNELLDEILTSGAIVYGTGYVAERFIESLRLLGISHSIRYCVTTQKDKDIFNGYNVLEISELKEYYDGELICIAVHEAIKDEIVKNLEDYSFSKYTWIYPYQHKLRFGEPIELNKEVKIVQLLNTTKNDYRIPVRIAAIEQFYGKNDCGYSIYLKAQSQHCDGNTAKKRLDAFIKLIKSWDKSGFNIEHRPAVASNYEIIDGVHRIALAIYHKMECISCDIYEAEAVESYRNEYIDIVEDVLKEAGLTAQENEVITAIHRYLIGQVESNDE